MSVRPFYPVADMREVLGVVSSANAEEEVFIDVDCGRIARQVRHSARKIIGLLPTDARAYPLPFARQLGFALSRLTQQLTVILDPEQQAGLSREACPPDGPLYYAQVAAPSVVVVAPYDVAPDGAKFEMVRLLMQFVGNGMDMAIAQGRPEPYGQILVDLSGCRRPGELLGAVRFLEGIILVGRSGVTTERDIERAVRVVPEELNLGVLLTA